MLQKTTKLPLFVGKPFLVVYFAFILSCLTAVSIFSISHPADASSPTLNFQARLLTSSGAIVPDGDYNVEFKIYSGASCVPATGSGCTTDWTEDYFGGSTDSRLRVADGYLTANLGSLTPFNTSIPWGSPLWLSLNIGGTTDTSSPTMDGAMFPYLTLTSVPSAMALDYTDGTHTGSLAFTSTLSGNDSITLPDASGTVCLATSSGGNCSAEGTGYLLNQSSTPGTAQNANFNITGTGIANSLQVASSGSIDTSVAGAGTLNIGTTNATGVTIGSASETGIITLGQATGSNTITIGSAVSGSATQTINIGTNSSTGTTTTVTIGSTTAGSSTTIEGGSSGGGVSIQAGSGGAITIGASGVATGTITLGQSTATNTIDIGNSNTATGNTQNINIGDGMDIGTGDAAVTIGNQANASATTIQGGTGNVNVLSSGSIDLGETSASGTTLGYTGIGSDGDGGGSTDTLSASEFTTTSGGTTGSMSVYVSSPSSGDHYQFAIYSNSSGAPGSYIAASAVGTLGSSAGWYTLPISATLSGSTTYWLVYWNNGTNGINYNTSVSGAAVVNNTYTWQSGPDNGFPTTFPSGGSGYSGIQASIYATYSTGIEAAVSINNFGNLTATGTSTFESANNSTTAFQIQNANGTNLLNVDTSLNSINLGATGSTALASTVNIATSNSTTNAQTVVIGSSSNVSNMISLYAGGSSETLSNTDVTILSGANITVGSTTEAGTITLGQSTATNTINIGDANTATGNAQTISVGAGTDAGTGHALVTVGNTNGASATTLQGGTGNVTVSTGNITGSTTTGSIVLQSGNSSTGAAGGVWIDTGTGTAGAGTSLDNDTFETGVQDMSNWYNTTLTQSTAQAHGGTHSLAVTVGSSSNWAIESTYAAISVTPGQTYNFTAWVRAASTSELIKESAEWVNGGTLTSVLVGSVTDNSGGWSEISGQLVAPAGNTALYIVFTSTGSANEVHYFDDLMVTADSTNEQVALGGSNAQSVLVGNNNETGATSILGGSGGIGIQATAAGTINVGTIGTGAISIGNVGSTTSVSGQFGLATSGGGSITLAPTSTSSNVTITLPAVTGTICLTTGNCSTAGSGYILNQSSLSTPQTGNFNVSGTGIAATELQTPLIDTPNGSTTLNIGQTSGGNATAIDLNQAVTVGADKGITMSYSSGNSNEFLINGNGAPLLTVDTSGSHVTIGATSACTYLQGRFCVSQANITSNSTALNQNNSVVISGSLTGETDYANEIFLSDSSSGTSTLYGQVVDATHNFTNTSSTVNSYTARVNASQPGNFLTFSNGATTELQVANNGAIIAAGNLSFSGTGSTISNPQGQTDGEAFGLSASVTGSDATALGYDASAYSQAVAFGSQASSSSTGAIAVGYKAAASLASVSVGWEATDNGNNYSVVVGHAAVSSGADGIAIGNSAHAASFASIAIGANATTTGAYQLVVGGSTSNGTYIQNVYIGSGVTDAAPKSVTIQGTGGSGANIAGASVSIAGGAGTGTGNGGTINLQVAAPVATSGSSLNNLVTVFSLSGTNGSASFQNATDSSTAFLIQDTHDNQLFNVNTSSDSITIGSSSNGVVFTAGTYEPVLYGSARHTNTITLTAEYAGATMTGSGTNNSGTMTSDNMTTSPFRNYYDWQTTQSTAQNYDIWVRIPVPSNFSGFPSGQTICLDTYANTTTANTITMTVYDTTNTQVVSSDLTPSSTSTWQNHCTSAITSGTYTANGIMTLDIKMTAPAFTGDVRIGNITLNYLSKW